MREGGNPFPPSLMFISSRRRRSGVGDVWGEGAGGGGNPFPLLLQDRKGKPSLTGARSVHGRGGFPFAPISSKMTGISRFPAHHDHLPGLILSRARKTAGSGVFRGRSLYP